MMTGNAVWFGLVVYLISSLSHLLYNSSMNKSCAYLFEQLNKSYDRSLIDPSIFNNNTCFDTNPNAHVEDVFIGLFFFGIFFIIICFLYVISHR